MNKQEAILKIKETLKSIMKFESQVVENTFAEVMTKDGYKLVFDGENLATDIEIFKLDEQGNRIPCEDGEYLLEDGRTIVITSGKVSEIKEEVVVEDGGETPVEDANVEAKKEDKMEIETEEIEKVEEVEIEVEEKEEEEKDVELKEKVKNLEEKLEKVVEMLNSLTGISEEMTQKFEEFSKQPGADAIDFINVDSVVSNDRVNRLKYIKNSLNKK